MTLIVTLALSSSVMWNRQSLSVNQGIYTKFINFLNNFICFLPMDFK
jgi:hypothetical protein